MAYIDITPENLATEHICCAISDKKGETCVADKKGWLAAALGDGLVFRKLDARGKVFIEYIPAERAWCPLDAPGYLHIHCLWVSGQFKGQGHAGALLASCVEDARAQDKHGVTILSARKKMPFLSDPKYMKKHGFRLADTARPYFELLYLPLHEDAPVPTFRASAKEGRIDMPGYALYYTNQCPFANTYAHRIQALAEMRGMPMTLRRLDSWQEAQQSPAPYATYSLFKDGQFVTNEILSEKKFAAMLDADL